MNKLFSTLLIMVLVFTGFQNADAQFWKKKKKVEKKSAIVKKEDPYKKLMSKTHETYKGLITIHKFKENNKLKFEVPIELLGKDLLLASTISATSDNGDGVVGEKPHEPIYFKYNLENDVVQMVCPREAVLKSKDVNIQRALEVSNIDPIYKTYKVEAYNSDSTAVVIDVTDLFVSGKKDLDPFSKYSKNTFGGRANRTTNFDKTNSYIKSVKSFSDNVTIKSKLSFITSVGTLFHKISSKKPFSAVVTRTILLLPEEPMRPRYADPRIGIFFNSKKAFTDDCNGAEEKFFTNRWRLEPKNKSDWEAGKLVEPVKPIIFYVDDNYPETWKKYVFEGVEVWQKAFEKAGFKNAIIAKPFPTKEEDPEFDPDNLKYSCLRYAPIDIPNSMGPSWIDPRSGEIINASVYSFHDVARLLRNWRFIQTAQCDKSVRKKIFDNETFGECLKYVISHEIGHCLGLMHNMSASAAIPTDSLRSAKFTQKYGNTYSIMDYARNNYVAQPGDMEKGVKLTPPELGIYDIYAINWLYRPILSAATPEDEIPTLRKWISEKSGNPIYRYGKQQLQANYDPSSITEDLGDDPIKSARYGIKNLKFIMNNLNNWVSDQDEDFSFRNQIYVSILKQYGRYLAHVYDNIGGVYLNEVYNSDKLDRCIAVSKERQRAALKLIMEEINSNEWLDNKKVNNFLVFHLPVDQGFNEKLFTALLNKDKSVKMASFKSKGNKYTEDQFLDDLYKETFKNTIHNRKLTSRNKLQQNQFVDYLLKESTLVKKDAHPMVAMMGINSIEYSQEVQSLIDKYDSSEFDHKGFEFVRPFKMSKMIINESVYFEQLSKIKTLLKSRCNKGDLKTRSHYKLLLIKINKSMAN